MQSLVFVVDFLLLGMLSYSIRQRYMREAYCPTATGNSIMALSLFALGAMQFLPNSLRLLTPYVFLEFLVVWLLITESYLKCFLEGHFYIHTRNMLNRFSIGSWVVGTSLLTILAEKCFPEWDEIIWLLGLISIAIWIEYTSIFINDLLVLSRKNMNLKINGNIFLGCISLQTLVLLLNTLLPDYFPMQLSILLVVVGYLFYFWSLILLLRSFLRNHIRHVLIDWQHVNSYIYAGLALSGLAALKIGVVPEAVIETTCVIAIILFLVIESMSLLKFFYNRKGKEKKYDASQWSQLFSFCALYLLIVLLAPFQVSFLKPIIYSLTHFGQYFLLALLLWEIGLFCKFNIKPPLKKTAWLNLNG